MNVQDLESLRNIWQLDCNLPIEPTRSLKSWIQRVGQIRCRHDDDLVVLQEAVHLVKQLVQCLFLLSVRVVAVASFASKCVDFIDEDHDWGSVASGLLEQVSHLFCSVANEDFDEFTAGGDDEGYVGLRGSGFGDKGFARSRWAV